MGSLNTYSRGFTLVELMLVLVVLSVMLSLAVAVLPDRNAERMANEAARLVKVLEALQMEAMVQRTQSGLLLEEGGYRAAVLNLYTLEWEASDLKILAPRNLQSESVELHLVHDDANDDAGRFAPERAGHLPDRPAITFDAAGLSDPYQLQLVATEQGELTAVVASDGLHPARVQ